MDVTIVTAGREDRALAGDRLGRRADGHRVALAGLEVGKNRAKSILNAGISRVANADNATALDADVGLYDAEFGVENQRVGDYHVKRFGVLGQGRLAHAVADHLAAAELDLVAVAGALGDEVALDLDEQISVAQTHLVAGGRPVNFRVLLSCESEWHVVLFLVMPATGR